MKVLRGILLSLLLFSILAGAIYWHLQRYLQQALPLQTPLVFEVNRGEAFQKVLLRLEAEGVIPHALPFRWYARYKGYDRSLKAGEYLLSPPLLPDQLFEMLSSGRSIQYSLQILEGWTVADLAREFLEHSALVSTLEDWSPTGLAKALNLETESAEGWFYPETYFYTRGSRDREILQRAQRKMETALQAAWEDREEGLPLNNAYEALILASIVEKETGKVEEQGMIAGVFIERLERRMRLQTDPTVIYGLGAAYQGNLTRKHLRTPSPWNTYVIRGLPPTPIAFPRGEALKAVLKPERKGFLYFVAKGDGSHQFSKTLAEHNRAVREYQLKRRKDYRSF